MHIEACTVQACDGGTAGGGICALHPSTVAIIDCEFLSNSASSGGGIVAFGPEVTIVDCVISHNVAGWGSAGGIMCGSPMLTIRDCLISDNGQVVTDGPSALYVAASSGSISGCTVVNNRTFLHGDPTILLDGSDIDIERTIIAFNEGVAMECWAQQVTVRCCDVFGNTEGDNLCGDDLGGNFSADPLFCDAGNGDYTLDGCSPCLPGNHPDGVDCGLIGALEQGCGATPIQETSWGRIKAQYRDRPTDPRR